MIFNFTSDELIAKVREITAERPDVTYRGCGCYYSQGECSDGSVGCIFGQAFAALGYDPAPLDDGVVPTVGAVLGGFPSAAVGWCSIVQAMQDQGVSWGEAVARANEGYRDD